MRGRTVELGLVIVQFSSCVRSRVHIYADRHSRVVNVLHLPWVPLEVHEVFSCFS